MKTKIQFVDGTIQIYFSAEVPEENIHLLKIAKRIKKPMWAQGNFKEDGMAWLWVNIPAKKISDYETTRISSETK